MPLYKFDSSDVYVNTIRTYPEVKLLIYNGYHICVCSGLCYVLCMLWAITLTLYFRSKKHIHNKFSGKDINLTLNS